MRITQLLTSTAFAAGLAALAPATATAQYIYPPCSPFPLTWPICVLGAAAAIVTAPVRAISGWPYYGYSGPPYYPPPPPPYYAPPPGGAAPYGQLPAYYPQAVSAYPQAVSAPATTTGQAVGSYSQPITTQPLPPQR